MEKVESTKIPLLLGELEATLAEVHYLEYKEQQLDFDHEGKINALNGRVDQIRDQLQDLGVDH